MADLLFNNIDDCSAVTISTPAPNNIIQDMTTSSSNLVDIQSFDVTWSNNCCAETIIKVAPIYDFGFEVSDCATFVLLATTFTAYSLELSGINGNFISTITAQAMNLPNSQPGNIVFAVQVGNTTTFDLNALASSPLIEYDLVITTLYGFVYTLHLVLTQIPGTPCVGYTLVFDSPAVTYPEVPTSIEYDSPSIINFNTLVDATPVLSGTYQVSICAVGPDYVSNCVQNHVFIDCGDLKCFVIRKWAECVDSDIWNYYDALSFANACTDNVTYDELCAIYEVLSIKLATQGCYAQEDDCNCMGVETKANKMLSPIRKSSPTKSGCGCG